MRKNDKIMQNFSIGNEFKEDVDSFFNEKIYGK